MYRAFTRVGLLATFDSPKSDIRTPNFPQIGSWTFGLLDTTPSSSDIGSPKVGILVFQIDWESDIRTPSFADSESECRTPSFSYIRSPTFGLLDTASENIITSPILRESINVKTRYTKITLLRLQFMQFETIFTC